MNHQLLVAEFLATPWALMPERLHALASVVMRWSAGIAADTDNMVRIQADRVIRETRRQASAAQSSGGIAVLPLYGIVTQRGNMVEESDAEDLAADAEALEAPAQEASEPPDDETAARLRALIASTAERWARRISRAGGIEEKDVDLIAEAFAVPPERVAAWAAGSKGTDLTEVGLCQSLTQLGMNTEEMNP